jgi:hypothetical protein
VDANEPATYVFVELSHWNDALKVSVQTAVPERPQALLPTKIKSEVVSLTMLSSAWASLGATRAVKAIAPASTYFEIFVVCLP